MKVKIIKKIMIGLKKERIVGNNLVYSFRRNRLIVVNTVKTNDTIPKTGWTFGYLVASQPAVKRTRSMGSIERMRTVFEFIQITSLFSVFQ